MYLILSYQYDARDEILNSEYFYSRKAGLVLRENNSEVLWNSYRSKKKVKWIIKNGSETHTVQCIISFYSGKKKVTHNGFTIMDIEN